MPPRTKDAITKPVLTPSEISTLVHQHYCDLWRHRRPVYHGLLPPDERSPSMMPLGMLWTVHVETWLFYFPTVRGR